MKRINYNYSYNEKEKWTKKYFKKTVLLSKEMSNIKKNCKDIADLEVRHKNYIITENVTDQKVTVKHLHADITIPPFHSVNATKVQRAVKNTLKKVAYIEPFHDASQIADVASEFNEVRDTSLLVAEYCRFFHIFFYYLPSGLTPGPDITPYASQNITTDHNFETAQVHPKCLVGRNPEWVLGDFQLHFPSVLTATHHFEIPLTKTLGPGDKIVCTIYLEADARSFSDVYLLEAVVDVFGSFMMKYE